MARMRTYPWVAVMLAALMSSLVSADENWEELRRAAERGDHEAQISLGYSYLEDSDSLIDDDDGIPYDRARAYLWLTLGLEGFPVDRRDTDTYAVTRDYLEILTDEMYWSELREGRRLVEEWRKRLQSARDDSVLEAQKLLTKLGYAPGPIDGMWGPRTERAYFAFLRDAGLPAREFSPNALVTMRSAVQSQGGSGGMNAVYRAIERRDYVTARRLLKPLAERGNSEAQGLLAFAYTSGLGGNRNYAAAVKWARRSADQGHFLGQNALGLLYFFGHGGLTTDYNKAADLYALAARQGEPGAQYMLATMYAYGLGVRQNYGRAAELAQDSLEQELPHAMVLFAELLANGNGVPLNRVQAYRWYTSAIHVFREFEAVSWLPSGHEADLMAKAEKGLHDLRRKMTPKERARAEEIAGRVVSGRPAAPSCPDGSPMLFGYCPGG